MKQPSTPRNPETTVEDLIEQIKTLKISEETRAELLADCEELNDPDIKPRVRSSAIKGISQKVAEFNTPSKTGSDISPSRAALHDLVDRAVKVVGVTAIQNALKTDINLRQSVEFFFQSRHKSIAHIGAKPSGTRSGIAVTLESGERFYVKAHDNHKRTEASGRLDPRELFLYKVLEYTGFGPKVEFIPAIKSGRANAIYIATLDVSHTKNPDKAKTFKTATDIQAEQLLPSIDVDNLKSKDSTLDLELCSLEIIDKVFALHDTFGNSGNYGVVESRVRKLGDGGEQPSTRMKPKLIDFTPPTLGDHVARGGDILGDKLLRELKSLNGVPLALLSEGKTQFYKKESAHEKKVGIKEAITRAFECVKMVVEQNCSQSLLVPNHDNILGQYVRESLERIDHVSRSVAETTHNTRER